MHGAIPPLPHTPSWRGAQIKNKSTGATLLSRVYIYLVFIRKAQENQEGLQINWKKK
jgi:hypothetical protein